MSRGARQVQRVLRSPPNAQKFASQSSTEEEAPQGNNPKGTKAQGTSSGLMEHKCMSPVQVPGRCRNPKGGLWANIRIRSLATCTGVHTCT